MSEDADRLIVERLARGEAGAPLLNFKGEVIGILVASIENGSACYALPINAAEKIRNDFIRFGVIPFAPTPRQADLMVVSGTVTS